MVGTDLSNYNNHIRQVYTAKLFANENKQNAAKIVGENIQNVNSARKRMNEIKKKNEIDIDERKFYSGLNVIMVFNGTLRQLP